MVNLTPSQERLLSGLTLNYTSGYIDLNLTLLQTSSTGYDKTGGMSQSYRFKS